MKKNTTNIELIKSIINTKQELDIANKNFEIAEGELIDYYAYQIKANKSKLNYLIREVKKQKLTFSMLNELKVLDDVI